MSDYKKCEICGEFGWAGRHKCPTVWDTCIVECDEGHWSQIRARDAEEAAEKRAEAYDADEHDMMDGEIITVRVRALGDVEGKEWWFSVSGEPIPTYYATKSIEAAIKAAKVRMPK